MTGARAALSPTPNMIGYGACKAAVHHLVQSLAVELSEDACVLALLPVTLDTDNNRKWMPRADQTTWTPLDFVSKLLLSWTVEGVDRPASGSLVGLITEKGQTRLELE